MLATLRHRDFALLWFAGLISVAGDFALYAALPLHAYALTGSAAAAGAVFAASLLPRVVLGPLAGVYVDRWDRKRTMVAADLLQAAVLLPLLAVDSAGLLWLLYLVRAVGGTLGLFFTPAESALLPRLVGEDQLIAANALNTLNNNLGRLIGPAIGGALYAVGGLEAVVAVDVASFIVAAGLIAMIRANARPDRQPESDDARPALLRVFAELRAGLLVMRQSRVISAVFLSFGLGFIAEGTFEVGFTPLVIDVFDGGATGVGILLSAQAVGGLGAGALIARTSARISPRLLFAGGLLGLGIADFGMVNSANLAPPDVSPVALAGAFMILAGAPIVALHAASLGILQVETTDAFRGRVFGALGMVEGFAILTGLLAGALTVDRFGIVPVLSAGALMWAVGGVVALVRLPRDAGVQRDDAHAEASV